jgi:hypothetical protein
MEMEKFLRDLRRLKEEVEDFERRCHDFLQSLPHVSDADFGTPPTTAARIKETLECLLGDDLRPVFKKLGELEGYLKDYRQPSGG